VGASAGGLEAFSELLRHLPPKTGMAFVLVQHLASDHKSVLAELLARETTMPVIETTQGLQVAVDSVYVIPAGQDMTIEEGTLRLHPRKPEGPHLPVDSFFTSLAGGRRDRAVGVVLSGTGADGAEGVRAIRAAGGLTMAQDPATAAHRGMPESAIATGAVDLVLPLPMIAERLATLVSQSAATQGTSRPMTSRNTPLLSELLDLVRTGTGVDFTHYKQPTLLRRVNRRMSLRHTESQEEYAQLLRNDPREVEALYQDILIHVTSFFRQPQLVETLKQLAFPKIVEATAGAQARIWVPGCASGEEAYSLAIAWAEFVGEDCPSKLSFQVFATDINQQVVDRARAGVYPKSINADVSPERLERFFTAVEGGYRVKKSLRDTCVFARHDLTRDPPFSRLDLISLRNVLIYLDPLLQRRVMPLLHFALRPGAFLVLGESESIAGFSDLFTLADKTAKLYVRRESVVALPTPAAPRRATTASADSTASAPEFDLSWEADRIILDRYSPIGVIVDADLQIRQFRGSPSAYLQLVSGRATLDLLRMTREGLAGELRSALREAARTGTAVERRAVRMVRDDRVVTVGFSVVPITSPTGESSLLVLFRDMPAAEGGRPAPAAISPPSSEEAVNGRLAELEQELVEAREYARAIAEDKESANEELRSANEELQSANEELQSINEELETTSEELQSTNEELQSLNDELRAVNEELDRRELEVRNARDYARAVVDTVREPLLSLDADLRVLSANRAYYRLFLTDAEATLGRFFFETENGIWNIAELRESVSRLLREGEDFQDLMIDVPVPRLGRLTLLVSGRPIRPGIQGPTGHLLLALDDITDRARATALSATLDEINLAMISSLDYEEILDDVLRKATEALEADEARIGVGDAAPPGVRSIQTSGDAWDDASARGARESAMPALRAVQTVSPNGHVVEVALPVRHGETAILSFARGAQAGGFSRTELDFIDKLAPGLALALRNADLFSNEHRIARVLQERLLVPTTGVPGVDIAVVYRCAHEAELVGGDFYDIFALDGGLVAAVVGDVSGKGVEAASLTGTVRATLRALASLEKSPSALLEGTNKLLLGQLTWGQFVTALLAIFDPATRKLTISTAGHPPAIVSGDKTRFVDVTPGLPLGLEPSAYYEASYDLLPGEAVVLYTDGLIEARRGSDFFGGERVAEFLSSQPSRDLQQLVDGLVSRATEFAAGRLHDDVAVVALRISAPPVPSGLLRTTC
jgi:chemotaxis methyl-accepting protein methylase